ncbi:MAG: hypothetical protein R6T98_06505 [Desulfatiglandales bacterium]
MTCGGTNTTFWSCHRLLINLLNSDYAVGIVTRVEKPQRNEKLERFCAEGIFVNMLRSKIVKRSL